MEEKRKIILDLIEKLTGQDRPLHDNEVPKLAVELLDNPDRGLGCGQFNELLLYLGYDRVSHTFFQYLVDGQTEITRGAAFKSIDEIKIGVDRFRKLGMLLYGNIKYAFKTLSLDKDEFLNALSYMEKRAEQSFKDRHDPIHPIEKIPGDKTYYLGYMIKNEINLKLKTNANDPGALEQEKLRNKIIEIGRRNYEAYLASDHLDVYVATSMRKRHEYKIIHELTEEIFNHPYLKDLKLRHFDPTQADCEDRIDKGLLEALMLKRAKCTIYLAQEGDTIGKDSELASTLAQGKPVIAFIPDRETDYAKTLLEKLKKVYPDREERSLLLEQLYLFDPEAAWGKESEVRRWIDEPTTFDLKTATARLQQAITNHYDRRANTLREVHPLGIQVNLDTGVANGVLVVRHTYEVAELVRRILLRELEFDIEEIEAEGQLLKLREKVSKSVFRVVTGNKMLTNSFWNFYLLNPIE